MVTVSYVCNVQWLLLIMYVMYCNSKGLSGLAANMYQQFIPVYGMNISLHAFLHVYMYIQLQVCYIVYMYVGVSLWKLTVVCVFPWPLSGGVCSRGDRVVGRQFR